jgi:hypothetical protein
MSGAGFCCERMRYAVETPAIPIVYTPKYREYSLRVLDGGTSTIEVVFCPWCGHKLPESLRDRWFEELKRLGIDPVSSDVPAEFQDDRWFARPTRK